MCIRDSVQPAAAVKFRLPVQAQDQVVLHRVIQHQALAVPVLGDIAQPPLADLLRAEPGDGPPFQQDLPLLRAPHAADGLHQLALAVAVHARQAEHLAAAHGKIHAVQHILAVLVPGAQAPHLQHVFRGVGRLAVLAAFRHVVAHHHGGDLQRVHLLVAHGADVFALPQHGDAVGGLFHLFQLVGDEDHRFPLLLENMDDRVQLFDLCLLYTSRCV